MKRLIASLALASPLLATALDFPASGWDISATDETGWNAPIPASETCYFNAEYGHVLRATADVSFWRMKFSSIASGTVFDLNQDGNHTVKILDTDSSKIAYGFQFANGNTAFTFRGGIWDFNKRCLYLGDGTSGNTVTFDQALLTNVLKVALSNYHETHNNLLILTNSTTVKVSGDFCLGDNGGYNNTVRIYSGCNVNVGGKLLSDDGGTVRATDNMCMSMCGDDARLWAAKIYWTKDSGGSRLDISDGAALSGQYLYFGNAATASNGVIVVDGDAGLSVSRAAYVGQSGRNATLLVSNSTFSVSGGSSYDNLIIGNQVGASNALLRIAGSRSVLNPLTWKAKTNGPYGYAGFCTFELADGVKLTNNVPSMTVGEFSDGNVFRLCGGASIGNASALTYTAGKAASDSTPATKDNRLEVLDNASLTCYRVYATGDNCGIVISNATLSIVNSYELGIILGGTGATNNYLRLEGASPRIRTSWDANGVKMTDGARIEFVLPSEPYADVVLRTHKILADSTCALKFDTSAIDSKPHGKLKYHLVRIRYAGNASCLDQSVLDAANAELAKKHGSLAWEGQDLYLTIKGNRGLCVIIR